MSQVQWPQVRQIAQGFMDSLAKLAPHLLDEMKGLAEGAEVDLLDIIALNVRTEIAFGIFKEDKETDGCTALYWKEHGILAQNWDWLQEQQDNLIVLHASPTDKPQINIVTEAGIVGKIGLNDCGVGVCLNAIRAKGLSESKFPIHIALRLALEQTSAKSAIDLLTSVGGASPGHILIGDGNMAQGLEISAYDVQKMDCGDNGFLIHTNHYLLDHPGVTESCIFNDSHFRLDRATELANDLAGAKGEDVLIGLDKLFKDEKNFPGSICRLQTPPSTATTIFNIVMDLRSAMAVVKIGRPVAPKEVISLHFAS